MNLYRKNHLVNEPRLASCQWGMEDSNSIIDFIKILYLLQDMQLRKKRTMPLSGAHDCTRLVMSGPCAQVWQLCQGLPMRRVGILQGEHWKPNVLTASLQGVCLLPARNGVLKLYAILKSIFKSFVDDFLMVQKCRPSPLCAPQWKWGFQQKRMHAQSWFSTISSPAVKLVKYSVQVS